MQSIVIIAIQFFPSGTCMHIRSQPVNMRNSQNYHFVSSGMKSMAKLQTKLVINNKFKAIRGFSLPSFFCRFSMSFKNNKECMSNNVTSSIFNNVIIILFCRQSLFTDGYPNKRLVLCVSYDTIRQSNSGWQITCIVYFLYPNQCTLLIR